MICSRIASSSRPSCSTSSADRWAIGLWAFFCRAVMRSPSRAGAEGRSGGGLELDVALAGSGGDAGLHQDAVALLRGGHGAVTQVAHGAGAQGHDAAEADAHAAPGRHEDAGGLAGLEQGGGTVGLDDDAAAAE